MLDFAGWEMGEEEEEEEEDKHTFHGANPVYSYNSKPVDTEHAIKSVIDCPEEFLSKEPPRMVTENYCFVVDGEATTVQEILEADKQFWKPTSRPVKYFYSEDMKTFSKVQIVLIKGQVISARRRTRKPSGRFEFRRAPLDKVFRVSRFFSHWFSCSKFHKIISIVCPVKDVEKMEFKRRIFVQYLWRDAKESEKLRVTMEYERKIKRTLSSHSISSGASKGRRLTMASWAEAPGGKSGNFLGTKLVKPQRSHEARTSLSPGMERSLAYSTSMEHL